MRIGSVALVVVVVLVACSTPAVQPTQPVRMAHDEVEPAPSAYREPADAGADATEETLRSVFERPDAAVTVVEKPVDASSDLPEGATYEDGILVLKATKQWWCAIGGSAAGFCGDDERGCRTGYKAKCKQVSSWSCLKATARTSGETMTGCFESYSQCDDMADMLAAQPEVREVAGCVIFRYDPKAKK